MDSGERRLTLRVRQADGTTIEHEASSRGMSIGDLKQSLSQATQIPQERIRLMFDNVILGDEHTLEHYAYNNQVRQLYLDNPRLAQAMMMANPQVREALENNSELRQMMSDPEIMRQGLNAAQNPRLMQEVQRNNDRALSNLESSPGGYAHIRRMYHTIHEPLAKATDTGIWSSFNELNRHRARAMGVTRPDTAKVNTTPLPNPWARRHPRAPARPAVDARNPLAVVDQVSRNADRLARLDISATRPPASPPGRQSPTDNLLALLAQGGFGPRQLAQARARSVGAAPVLAPGPSSTPERHLDTGSEQPQPQPQLPPVAAPTDESRRSALANYHDMLEQLEEMGFPDKDKNLRALIEADGDLDQALNIITDEDAV
ncbi:hypothetical protein LPJ61_002131 [Coemansia biformis]|uniref:UBA domain-containing protein n=1 Tax=Coemansia biformis TaxID=1286918 RepID=A0A9W7YDX0_9FUNG|nr:hypothetical protein LPJ61_002131 [Coemansia biformis]